MKSGRLALDLSALTSVWLEDDHGEPRLVIHQRWGDTVRLTAAEVEGLAQALQPMLVPDEAEALSGDG